MTSFLFYFGTLSIVIVVTSGMRCSTGRCIRNESGPSMLGKIYGGDKTTIDQFPHAVFLSMVYQKWICGSSLLNQWVLTTAAHCVDSIYGEYKIDAYAGNEDLHKVTIIKQVDRFSSHKLYKSEGHKEFDIALMFLEDPMPLGQGAPIKRVTISANFPSQAETAVVAGWGMSNDLTKSQSVILRSTKQKIINLEKCTSYKYWNPGLLCAGGSYEHRPSKGDSGSGLLTEDYQQIGIVAFRVNHMTDVVFYTNVSYYYHWIENEINRECAEAVEEDEYFIK